MASTVRLHIEYDGGAYSGWQAQSNGIGIQSEIENALFKVTGEKIHVAGSGRTDAGVHAIEQVASFTTASNIPADRFAAALNSHLPADITVLSSEQVPDSFHARKGVKRKTYLYRIFNRRVRPALLRGQVYHFVPDLSEERMAAAARHLIGTHDFSAFTPPASARPNGHVREIFDIQVRRIEDEIRITVAGSGFLHNMVRIIVGTLIEAGRGKIDPGALPGIISSRDRRKAGPTVPPCGLYMAAVDYGEDQSST